MRTARHTLVNGLVQNGTAMVFTVGRMVPSTKVSSRETERMVRAHSSFQMAVCMKANGRQIVHMATEVTDTLTRPHMMASGAMTSNTAKVLSSGQTVLDSKVSTGKARKVVKANCCGRMGLATLETLSPTRSMATACIAGQMAKSTAASGPEIA